MPRIKVNNVDLEYELIGKGSPIVWTGGGWLPRLGHGYVVAGRLSSNHQVLVWDRRNCGQSDIALDENQPSEFHSYAHDLHEILHVLDLAPAIIGGCSGGYITSMLLAHLYPEDVKGLILWLPPTMRSEPIQDIAQRHYLECADLAESKGMEAVTESTAFAFTRSSMCERNPENAERLIAMGSDRFVALMGKWAEWGPYWSAGLSDGELQRINMPAIVTPGYENENGLHPWQSAAEVCKRLPNAEFLDWKELIGDQKWQQLQDGEISEIEGFAPVLDVWERFIEKVS